MCRSKSKRDGIWSMQQMWVPYGSQGIPQRNIYSKHLFIIGLFAYIASKKHTKGATVLLKWYINCSIKINFSSYFYWSSHLQWFYKTIVNESGGKVFCLKIICCIKGSIPILNRTNCHCRALLLLINETPNLFQ